MTSRVVAAYAAMCAIWGTTWIAIKIALTDVVAISFSGDGGTWTAIVAALAASAISAYSYIYIKLQSDSDPFETLPPAMLFSGIVMALAGAALERTDPHVFLAARPLLATLYLGIAGSGIAFFLNLWLLARLAAWTVGLSSLLVPVIAVAIGALVGHETFGPRELAGTAFVCAGVWLATKPSTV